MYGLQLRHMSNAGLTIIVALFCVNALCAQPAGEVNSLDGQAMWKETQTPIVRTLAELRRLQKELGAVDFEVDLQAQLTFSAQHWSVFFVQDGGIAAMVHCSDAASAILYTQPAGKWLRLRGLVYNRTPDISLVSLDLLPDVGELSPLQLTTIPDAKRLTDEPIRDKFVEVRCQLLEVLDQHHQSLLFAKVGDRTVELHVEKFLAPEQYKSVNSGKSAMARGVISPKNSWTYTADCAIRMLDHSQLSVVETEPSTLGPSTTIEAGQVLFTDNAAQLVVGDQGHVWRVSTGFAEFLKPGQNVSITGELVGPATHRQLVARHLKSDPPSELPMCLPLAADAWEQAERLPPRVELEAVVVAPLASELLRRYQMRSGGTLFTAIINEPVDKPAPYRTGDRVQLKGTPLVDHTVDALNRDRLNLYVLSSADTQFVSGPLQLSVAHLAWAASIVLMLVGVVFSWNWMLHRLVNERTRGLKKVSSHLRMSFDAINEAILVTNADGRLSVWNRQFERLFGVAPVENQAIDVPLEALRNRLADSSVLDPIISASRTQAAEPTTATLHLENPVLIVRAFVSGVIDSDGTYQGHLFTFEDITEKLRLENELFQSQKMEAIGQLSGGVAHDFNNLLTVVSSNLALIKFLEVPAGLEYVDAAEVAVRRAAELTQQLLDFSRRSKLDIQVVNLNEMVGGLGQLLRRTFDRTISLQIELCSTPLFVCIDTNRIEQVLINICINARDALKGRNGKITVRVSPSNDDGDDNYACIEIEDNGCGMSREVQSRIFDPFFTTKKPGEGTGLGLSMAQGVIEQLGGRIHCFSKLDVGTRFRIELPLTDLSESSRDKPASVHSENQRSLRILLVDDEVMVRTAGEALLRSMGHAPIVAGGGQEALDILENETVDVVLLDLTMPNLSGKETYIQMHTRWPSLPVAICTGYYLDAKTWNNDCEVAPPKIISKPYSVESLSNFLNSIDGRASLDSAIGGR